MVSGPSTAFLANQAPVYCGCPAGTHGCDPVRLDQSANLAARRAVVAVPMISLDWVPQRYAVRCPQKAEQLVEVLTVVSCSSLQQQSAEQNVDIPVPGTRGDHGGLQGFHPRQSSTASV